MRWRARSSVPIWSQGGVVIRITEVEAYGGSDDAASHAFRGKTNRNAVMFGPPGHLYVYLSYGIHCCANVVCGPEGIATAVLLRAGTAVEGESTIRSRRGEGVPAARLLDGPGKLCQALGIDRSFDGADLVAQPKAAHSSSTAPEWRGSAWSNPAASGSARRPSGPGGSSSRIRVGWLPGP